MTKVILETLPKVGERFKLSGVGIPPKYVDVWFEVIDVGDGKIKLKVSEK